MHICDPLPNLSEEHLLAIIEADWKRNYASTSVTVEDMLRALFSWLKSGKPIGFAEDVIILGDFDAEGNFEFHSINGASVRKVLQATRRALQQLREQGVLFACTYFENFRVSDMAQHCGFPYVTDFSPTRSTDRKYCTTFYLGAV